MNDRQRHYILTIAQEGSITAAANKLYISQPSLSALLANVEESLSVKLFDRNSTPIVPTFAGEHFIKASKQILDIQRKLENQIDEINKNNIGRVVIGCTPQLSSILFPNLLTLFMKENPGVQLKLFEEDNETLENLMMTNSIEVALTTSYIGKNTFDHIPLFKEELILVAPMAENTDNAVRNDTQNLEQVDLSIYKEHKFVLFKPNHYLRQFTDKLFSDHGFEPDILLETDNWESCYNMAKQGLACTVLPYYPLQRIKNAPRVRLYRIKGSPFRQLNLYYQKSRNNAVLIDRVIEVTKRTVNKDIWDF
ncbi:LysR family transcriptional regulator [Fusibacter paucivorans]|uniref:LysR family transcriptional regulator n=1 Tax=Fusibacter paucivorans TaxID=76009 RepID=A0ABS5PN94_9FIRM|nr:LysR family transcriptional regulator [Fusibacter paucivorans]MBS7526377.1 LysR family transcriptional regulator [Fusibacter paucivorans]